MYVCVYLHYIQACTSRHIIVTMVPHSGKLLVYDWQQILPHLLGNDVYTVHDMLVLLPVLHPF